MKVSKPNLGTWYLDKYVTLVGRPERDAVLEFLQAAYAREYLTEAEHEQRAGLALGARDTRVLGEVIRDLPYSIELPGRQPVSVRRSLLDMQLSELAKRAGTGLKWAGLGLLAVGAWAALVTLMALLVSALAGR